MPVVDGKTAKGANKDLLHLLHLALMERGLFNISTPMTEKEIDLAVKAVDDALSELARPIEQIWPELVGNP